MAPISIHAAFDKVILRDKINLNGLYFMEVAHNSLGTNKPVALRFLIELEFRSGHRGFCGGWKTIEPRGNSLEQGPEPKKTSD